jgi:hypothetical protein
MVKKVKSDKVSGIVTLEISRNELKNMMDSVDVMVDKQQRNLLKNLPSEERDRHKLDNYKALKEDLKKIWET